MSEELADQLVKLNLDVLRIRLCWRAEAWIAVAYALAADKYEPGGEALGKIALALDGWGEILSELAMRCYDARDAAEALDQ